MYPLVLKISKSLLATRELDKALNNNGKRLRNFTSVSELKVTNTLFKKKDNKYLYIVCKEEQSFLLTMSLQISKAAYRC